MDIAMVLGMPYGSQPGAHVLCGGASMMSYTDVQLQEIT